MCSSIVWKIQEHIFRFKNPFQIIIISINFENFMLPRQKKYIYYIINFVRLWWRDASHEKLVLTRSTTMIWENQSKDVHYFGNAVCV